MRPSRPGTPVSASGTKGFKLPLVAGALEG